jgi:hypothetical protein
MADKSGIAIGLWFIGEDKTLRFTVYSDTAHTTCVDVSGYALQYILRKGNSDSDPALITKATGGSGITITGSFNATPASNTQRVLVAIEDSDTSGLKPGSYQHALKRTDAGAETILFYSDEDTAAVLTKSAAL